MANGCLGLDLGLVFIPLKSASATFLSKTIYEKQVSEQNTKRQFCFAYIYLSMFFSYI